VITAPSPKPCSAWGGDSSRERAILSTRACGPYGRRPSVRPRPACGLRSRRHLALHVAVARATPGSVLVVSVGDVPPEVLGRSTDRAAVPLGSPPLIDGCVRDADSFEVTTSLSLAQGLALRAYQQGPRRVGSREPW